VVGTLQTRNITIQIMDINGRVVAQQQQRYQNTTVNISKLQSGSYVLRIQGNNRENFVKQFIK
jgi:hypothetical protein